MATDKPVHTLVLDTGAIIKNEPPVSTLLAKAESLVTVPAIISEIKDAATRSRVQTTLQPFLTIRSPSPGSIKFVTEFARKTGDLAVLSKPDIQIIALTYEIECERNGGDWRLRRNPGQKGVNGAPPVRAEAAVTEEKTGGSEDQSANPEEENQHVEPSQPQTTQEEPAAPSSEQAPSESTKEEAAVENETADLSSQLQSATLETAEPDPKIDSAQTSTANQQEDETSSSDSEGWITPSNLKKKQAQDSGTASTTQTPEPKTMQVAVLTSDFAMQNVILQINLNLLSPSITRIKQLKTYVLRCHACFSISKDLAKQFCPRCGQPSLTRVSCSTSANGEFKLHLKKNMQWNHRGDRYSIPKPVHGSSNGRIVGGGKGGWGHELILAEDQKEYQQAAREEGRRKERSLMDEDYLPGILTGDRGKTGGRTKVGAGRNVNSRKR